MRLRTKFPWQNDPTGEPLLDRETLLGLLHQVRMRAAPALAREREVQHARVGEHRSAARGRGFDYEESRPYQRGDDLRFMNWRLTARAGEPYMKVFREQRSRSRYVLVDRRASMRFGTRVRIKAAQAATVAAIAAFDSLQQTMAVGGLLLEAHGRWLPAAEGENAAFALACSAAAACPPLAEAGAEPDLGRGLRQLLGTIEPGSSVVLVSDFLDLDERQRHNLLRLAAEHEVSAVRILDAAELELPAAGLLHLTAPAGGEPLAVDTSDATVRRRYAEAAHQRLEQARQLLTGTGIAVEQVYTDEPADTLIDRLLTRWDTAP
jgi:uncharacterized protein (DUF58 family)